MISHAILIGMSLNSLFECLVFCFDILTSFEMSFRGGVQLAVHAHVIWDHLSAGATAAILLIHRLSVGCLRLMHIILGTLCPPQSPPKGQAAKRNQHLIAENKGCGCSFHTVLPIPIKSNFVTWTYWPYCNSFTGRFMLVTGHDRCNMMYQTYILK